MAKKKNEHAAALSKLGAAKGGRARKNTLTPEERSEIARRASLTRWGKDPEAVEVKPKEIQVAANKDALPYSMFRGELALGELAVECHVLSDQRRVLTQREVVRIISGGRESGNLARYLSRHPKGEGLETGVLRFEIAGRPQPANGYDASILIDICTRYLEANDEGLLRTDQQHLAKQAEIVIRACAKVGIIALIDEATGFQEYRAKQALQVKLQAFIAEEMQAWVKQFPDEFWLELARLEGIRYSPRHRPIRWGKYVMHFVYDAIDKDLGKRLREINRDPKHGQNHHQWLREFGKDRLQKQLGGTIAIMKLCDTMEEFREKFAHVFKNEPLQNDLDFG